MSQQGGSGLARCCPRIRDESKVNRKNSARGLLLASVLLALALGRTWVTITEDNAGTLLRFERNGAVTLPSLDALLIANLVTVLALFLLPRFLQRLLLSTTAAIAVFSLWHTASWLLGHEVSVGPMLAILSALLTAFVAVASIRGTQAPVGPRPERADPWRALDQGIDPTQDR